MIGDNPLKPYQAMALARASDNLLFQIGLERELHGSEDGGSLLVDNGVLPPKHAHRYDLKFLKMFEQCVEHVTFKLLSPHPEDLGCTGEELALAGLFRSIPTVLDEHENIIPEENETDIESEFSDLHSLMMEDPDYEFLFDASYDGIEGVPTAGMVNLEFNKWFQPFNSDRTVHWQLPTWVPLEPSFSDPDEDD